MDEEKNFLSKAFATATLSAEMCGQYLLPTGERYDENQFLPKLLLLISKYANIDIFW